MLEKMKRGALLVLAALLLSGCAAGNLNPDPPQKSLPLEDLEVSTPTVDPEQPQHCVVLDPGHQQVGDPGLEPLGPGSTEMKARVTGGTTGRFTGIPEYVCNLEVSLLLREVLESRGYRVVMTREEHDVSISNRERAELAVQAQGEILVRLHANGSDDPTAQGAMTICMTRDNPFHPELYAESYLLASCILDAMTASAGCVREKIWETDTMTGINWAEMPCTIVEMGYMTNEIEDHLLADADYRMRLAEGIADGIDRYFAECQIDEA